MAEPEPTPDISRWKENILNKKSPDVLQKELRSIRNALKVNLGEGYRGRLSVADLTAKERALVTKLMSEKDHN
jgi:hypothetical protein